jgi:hypothetical protein
MIAPEDESEIVTVWLPEYAPVLGENVGVAAAESVP